MEKSKLKLLKIKTFDGNRERGVKMFIPTDENSQLSQPIGKQVFKNYINEVIDGFSVKINNYYWSYFLIELNVPFHFASVSDMIKSLNLEVKSIINPEKILVRGNKETLKKYLEKTIHKKVTEVIKDISILNPEQKISSALNRLLRYDVEKKHSYNIFVKFIDNLNFEELIESKKELARTIGKSISELNIYEKLNAISTRSSATDISKISKLSFVKLISKNPDITEIKDIYKENHENKFEDYNNLDISKNIIYNTPICIIDSGISPVLSDFVIEEDSFNFKNNNETIPHGTSVGSVAIFGNSLINKEKKLIGTNEIYSYKIEDYHETQNDEIRIVEGTIQAIDKFREKTLIFNLSYNYFEIDPELRKELIKDLDKKIQMTNSILVCSGGNIDESFVFHNINNYPNYLLENNVFSPADCRNCLAVGSIDSKKEVSKFSRLLTNPLFINEEIDSFEYFKPEILTYGGNYEITEKDTKIDKNISFPVMFSTGDLYYEVGTSYSAPLISKSLSIIYSKYKDEFKNSETYRAILLNNSELSNLKGHSFFKLDDIENISYSSDSILVNFEGEVHPSVKSENKKRTEIISCKKVKFYIPKEAKSFRVVIVHSNNYKFNYPEEHLTNVTCKFKKPEKYWKDKPILVSKKFGTMARYHTTTFGQYEFSRNFEGIWEAEVHMEAKKIPKSEFKNIKVRFGISIKIELKDEYKHLSKLIHDKIKLENENAFEELNNSGNIIDVDINESQKSS